MLLLLPEPLLLSLLPEQLLLGATPTTATACNSTTTAGPVAAPLVTDQVLLPPMQPTLLPV